MVSRRNERLAMDPLPMTCHCERLLRSNLPRMEGIASAQTTGLAMTVIVEAHPAAAAWVTQNDRYSQ